MITATFPAWETLKEVIPMTTVRLFTLARNQLRSLFLPKDQIQSNHLEEEIYYLNLYGSI